MEGKPEDMREAVRAFLFEHAEEQYRNFSKSLTPGNVNMLGVRLPVLRKKAKELAKGNWRKEWETEDFIPRVDIIKPHGFQDMSESLQSA